MSKTYPASLAVIAPQFVIAPPLECTGKQYVFFYGFALLVVTREGRGFRFSELRAVDETGSGTISLLVALADRIDPQASLAGLALSRTIAALIRAPLDDVHEAKAKPALQKLMTILTSQVHDAAWHARDPHRSLDQLATDFDLPAEWFRPTRQLRPEFLERQLSAQAQTIWLAVAHALLPPEELRRALADYDQWRTSHSIA